MVWVLDEPLTEVLVLAAGDLDLVLGPGDLDEFLGPGDLDEFLGPCGNTLGLGISKSPKTNGFLLV